MLAAEIEVLTHIKARNSTCVRCMMFWTDNDIKVRRAKSVCTGIPSILLISLKNLVEGHLVDRMGSSMMVGNFDAAICSCTNIRVSIKGKSITAGSNLCDFILRMGSRS